MKSRDCELLARFVEMGDETAFSRLVDFYGGLVFGVAKRVTGETESAKEAAQNTFVTLARRAPSLVGRESIGGWLHNAAVLSARNVLRTQKREARKRVAWEHSLEPGNLDPGEPWDDMGQELDLSLASMSERDRDALVLRYYRDCSVKEVASAMGVSLAATRKRLARALEKLRGNLEGRGVKLSSAAVAAGLGLWSEDANAAAGSAAGWAAGAMAAAASGPPLTGASLSTLSIMTITKSKLSLAGIVGILLIGATSLVILKQEDPPADSPSKPDAGSSGGRPGLGKNLPRHDSATHIAELKRTFGDERVRQALRIAQLFSRAADSEFKMAVAGLVPMTEEWIKQKGAEWELDEDQIGKLEKLVADEQIGRVGEMSGAFNELGQLRKVGCAEALLLADKVARGELDRDEFEERHSDLSTRGGAKLWQRMGKAFAFDSYLMDESFASRFEETISPGDREQFRSALAESNRRLLDNQIARLRNKVPDLSEGQVADLEEFTREVGKFDMDLEQVEEFLTEAQIEFWKEEEEKFRREHAHPNPVQVGSETADFHGFREDGSPAVATEIPRLRQGDGRLVPAYPFEQPMTLDAVEAAAQAMSRGGSVRSETTIQIDSKD